MLNIYIMYCENCINPPVYFVIDEDENDEDENNGYVGWCEECGKCKCGEPITHRVKYAAYAKGIGKLWLCTDVCENHIEDVFNECHCSMASTERQILKYENVV